MLEKVKAEIGDLYPPIPDPRAKSGDGETLTQTTLPGDLAPGGHADKDMHFGYFSAETHKELIERYDRICCQLTRIMAEPHKWKPRGAM